MVNQNLFSSVQKNSVKTDIVNDAQGVAYALSSKEALAQFAVTGCFSNTFYASDDIQLQRVLELAKEVDGEFLAKVTLYSSEKAWLKDMPAALLTILSKKDIKLFHKVFNRVVRNGKVLKAFFQFVRSGVFDRKSLSYALQKEVQNWLLNASVDKLLDTSIGNDPSLRDVLRCARPTPKNKEQSALFNFLVDKKDPEKLIDLPDKIKALNSFRNRETTNEKVQLEILSTYKFRWDLISGDIISDKVWKEVAKGMGHQALRMNLNTLIRHNVFDSSEMVTFVADKLSDKEEILKAKQYPYQYLAAYKNCDPNTPIPILKALNIAVDIAISNIPQFNKTVLIGLDVSGSMSNSITGNRTNKQGKAVKPSKIRCVDVAALFASVFLKNNSNTIIVPFDERAYDISNKDLMDKNTLALADWLAKFGGGGTNCSLPLKIANQVYRKSNFSFDACILISDNESWITDSDQSYYRRGNTGVLSEWNELLVRNKKAKLICIDLVPNMTTQAPNRKNILNVGGWNDSVFTVINSFLSEESNFVSEIEKIVI